MTVKPLHDYETASLVIDRMRRLVEPDAWHKATWLAEFARMIELTNSLQASEGIMGIMRAVDERKIAARREASDWRQTG